MEGVGPNQASEERWQLLKSIVAEALEEKSPNKRAENIRKRCGEDKDLLREVESLLDQTTSAFEEFARDGRQSLQRELSVLASGQRLGAYEILGELGRGGMGAVYLARRADGMFEKKVAIKILKRGTDTDEVLRRFQAEREILARLVHPNIARLLDAGTTENGLPYFVMDYVAGKPMTVYANERGLSIPQRLGLFRVACTAVSYAHQNLVVHRDLKPANVLVTNQGEIKLLDFGIAKLTDESNANITLTVQRRLTPLYASPEQVRGEPVTTVSDVYSLGVFLYELLTGEPPYRLEKSTSDEITEAICEQPPQRPSTAVSRNDPNSKIENQNSKILRGDIDNIVLKALRKEPSRRYPSVDQFSEDIRRYLEGLPVRARNDTMVYRASKFIGRHKVGVTAAILTAGALIAASIATAWEAREARREKSMAEERFADVRQIAHSVMFDYHDAIATLPGSTRVREQMVKDSLRYLDKLAPQAGDDIELQREIASAYLKVGDVQGRAFRANLGDTSGAMASYRKSLAIRERLTAREPTNPRLREELGTSYERIAGLDLFLGNPTAAIENAQKAITIYEQLSVREPANNRLRAELGRFYQWVGLARGASAVNNLGDVKGALECYRQSIAILEPLVAKDPSNLTCRENLAAVYSYVAQLESDGGDQVEAVEYYRKALANNQSMANENPTDMFLQRELAVNYSNLCGVQTLAGDATGAVESCRRALPIFEAMSSADPNDKNMRLDRAIIHRKLAEALGQAKDRPGALEHFRTSLQIFKELSANNSRDDYRLRQEGLAYLRFSEFLSGSGNFAGAVENAQRAAQVYESLLAANSNNTFATKQLALSYAQEGECHRLQATVEGKLDRSRGDWEAARDWYAKSLDLYKELESTAILSPADANKTTELAADIATCDQALK